LVKRPSSYPNDRSRTRNSSEADKAKLQHDQLEPDLVCRYASALDISEEDALRMLRELNSDLPSEVTPRLYLGNAAAAANLTALRRRGVTHVLNASRTIPNHFEPVLQYMRVAIDDSDDADLLPHLDAACQFISAASGSVLVHCQQGVSRSAAIVIAFYLREHNIDVETAVARVHQKRWIRPNEGFMWQLRRYQQSVRQQTKQSGHNR